MNVRPMLLRAAATFAVLLPFAISVAAHVGSDDTTAGNGAGRVPIAFGEYLVNLGRLPEGGKPDGVFRFRNVGDTPLEILGFSTSCGCLSPRLEERKYAPGASGRIVVVADTASETGLNEDVLKEHYVDVRYDAGAGAGEQIARVHLKFVLPARHITIEPRALAIYKFGPQEITREIKVNDPRTPPVTITKVESLSDSIEVDADLATSSNDPERATITITIPAALDRNVRTLIKLHTDDPRNPELTIPVMATVSATPPEKPATTSATSVEQLSDSAAEVDSAARN